MAAVYAEEGRMEGYCKDVVLHCEGCRERIVLSGPLSVWSGERTYFECGCGARLTLSQQVQPQVLKERVGYRGGPFSGSLSG